MSILFVVLNWIADFNNTQITASNLIVVITKSNFQQHKPDTH